MVLEELALDILQNIGKIALWMSAAGLLIILWIIFQIINLIIHRKKRKALYNLRSDLNRIEKKIDKLLNKKNKK
jgi:beta-lactamase regulating signal transducer with metallopeptidase domain